jgi:hypothetical protein
MTTCPGCFGDGHYDFRDDDAHMSEMFTDAELERMRTRGLNHPAGIVVCPTCGGAGEVTDDVAADLQARARAMVDQVIAKYEADERELAMRSLRDALDSI